MSLNMNIDDGTIFQYSITSCNDNTIYSLVNIFIGCANNMRETNTTTKYTIVCLFLEFNPENAKATIHHSSSLFMNIDDETIFQQYTIQRCICNTTFVSVATFSRVVQLRVRE